MQGQAALFHDELPLVEVGPSLFEIDSQALGLDPEALDLLVRRGPLCFVDLEATGLDALTEGLIEVGAVLVEPGKARAQVMTSFVATDRELPPFIQRLTGIVPSDLTDAPAHEEVAARLDSFIGSTPVVAHNTGFESRWLAERVNRRFAEHLFLDTVELLALAYPDSRNMKLDTFCRDKLGRRERHRALDDALDTLRLTVGIISDAGRGSTRAANAHRAMRMYRPSSPWLERMQDLPNPDTAAAERPAANAATGSGLKPVGLDLDAIVERLSNTQAVAGLIPGYQARPGQLRMVRSVYESFMAQDGKSVRVMEAGTGIGKTLAYLAVAIPFARESREPVIISTSSKVLQTQLIEKDIPAAARLLGYPDIRFTSMKGRANYLCRTKLDRFLDDQSMSEPPPDSFGVALLSAFANTSGHGEVDRIPGVLYQIYPELERHRREVTSSDSGECSRQTCHSTRTDCVFRRARERLEGAEIAVVNHDLLLRWPSDYPQTNRLVIDEVHELSERADSAYARTAEAIEILHRIEATVGDRSRSKAREVEVLVEAGRRARALVTAVGAEARVLVGGEEVSNQAWRDELALPDDDSGAAWKELIDASLELAAALDTLARGLAEIADSDESPESGAAEAFADAAEVLSSSFPQPPSGLVVRFRGLARRSTEAWRLVATPVSPAADFQLNVLDQVETLFGTSATLAIGEDIRGSLGPLELPERSSGRFNQEPSVPSPFDFENNLEIVFITDRTDHSRLVDKTVIAIEETATRLGGRTLGLFTSRDRLSTATDILDHRLRDQGITVIAPISGNADPHELVRSFMETERSVLLGSRAFWQGVDVPGPSCQALVIEKLPFDVPSDPLLVRRGKLIEEDGGNGFMDFTLPRMLLRLKQMIGRLIRTPTDRGIVVIVEPRSEKRYFGRLADALPLDAPHTKIPLADLADYVDGFARRIGL